MGIIRSLNQEIPVPLEKEQLVCGMGGVIQPVVFSVFVFQRIWNGNVLVFDQILR